MNSPEDVKNIIKKYKLERKSLIQRIKSTSWHPHKLNNIMSSLETLASTSPAYSKNRIFKTKVPRSNTKLQINNMNAMTADSQRALSPISKHSYSNLSLMSK